MAITTYSALLSAVGTWMHRVDLSGRDEEAVDNFEAAANRRLRLNSEETTTTGNMVADTATITLPATCFEIRTLTYAPSTGSVRKLEYITPEQADALELGSSGAPQWFTLVGGAIRLYPTPDSAYAYTLKYYTGITALSSSSGFTTNWLLSNNPDLYLTGSLVELCAFTGDDPRLAVWKTKLEEGLQELIRSDRRRRFISPVVNFDAELKAFPTNRNIESDGE